MKFVVARRRGISLLHKGESCGGLAEVAPTSIIQDSSEEIDCYYYIPKCALVPAVQNFRDLICNVLEPARSGQADPRIPSQNPIVLYKLIDPFASDRSLPRCMQLSYEDKAPFHRQAVLPPSTQTPRDLSG